MTEHSLSKWIDTVLASVGPFSPIKSCRRLFRRPTDYPVHVWGCTLATDASGNVSESSDRMSACGVALNPKQAMAAALGEACERYAFSACPTVCEKEIIRKHEPIKGESISNLPFLISPFAESIVDIEKALCCEKKWLSLPRWQAGCGLSDEKITLPVSMLFADHSNRVLPASTTGMAAGPTTEFALSRAICELVERDAFMCAWFHRYAGKRIDVSCLLSKQVVGWVQRLRDCNVDFRIHDISSDLVPFHVFLGYVTRLQNGTPVSFACGAGCSLDPYDAARRAFLEAALSWRGSDDLLAIRGVMSDMKLDAFEPVSFSDHSYLYQHKRALHAVAHFLEQESTVCEYNHFVKPESDTDQFQAAIQALEVQGYNVHVLDTTPGEFKALPIKVVRAVIPGLVPLSWGPYRPQLTTRFMKPGWIHAESRRTILNPDRHPFP